jgi:16S rRNA (guanine1207-N2)-methyltransferase
MKLQSCLLCETVQFNASDAILVLNSAHDPFVHHALERISTTGTITLAEDSIAHIQTLSTATLHGERMRRVAFHDYILHHSAETVDIAVMNLLYQPSNAWILYGLHVAAHALRQGGKLYVVGAKERGILSLAKRLQEYFGNVETAVISKGHRVLYTTKNAMLTLPPPQVLPVFAENKLDEGTRLLLTALEVHATDNALDIGCGVGFIGLHIARLAERGKVTMVDVSLAALEAARQAVAVSGLTNVEVVPSDGVRAVSQQRFDLIATNPPFHQGGIQTTGIAERFISDAAQVLQAQGRFYLVANRFLKYEPIFHRFFSHVEEVAGDTKYKVLRAMKPKKEERNLYRGMDKH